MNIMARLRAAAAVCGALVLISCGGGGGGGSTPDPNAAGNVNVTGLVGGAAPAMGRIAAQAAAPDAVWAIPIAKMQGASLDPINVLLRQEAALGAGGSFSFDLGKSLSAPEIAAVFPGLYDEGFSPTDVFEVDWILVLMSGTTPISYVELEEATSGSGLMNLPISFYSGGSLDLGIVDPSTGSATTSVASISTNINLTAAQLATIAKVDDLFKSLEDLLRNCDFTVDPAVCVSGRLSHAFSGTAHPAASGSDVIASIYGGYQIYFDVNDRHDDSDFAAMCDNSGSAAGSAASVEYRLTPPGGGVTATESSVVTAYGSGNPMLSGTGLGSTNANGSGRDCFKDSSAGNGSANIGMYLRDDADGEDGSAWLLQFVTGDNDLIFGFPAGSWVLERRADPSNLAGATFSPVGSFRFEFSSPLDANDKPKVFVPSLRVTADALSGQINSLTIKWWQYTGAGASGYEPADVELLNDLLGGFGVSVDDFDGTSGNGNSRRSARTNKVAFAAETVLDLTPSAIATTLPDDSDGGAPFFYSCNTDGTNFEAVYIGIDYQIAGQGMRFVWRCN